MSLNPNSETDLVSESELRAALRCHQIDADTFEATVRARIQVAETKRTNDPLANTPRLLRVVAALLPIPATGSKVIAGAVPLAHASSFSKLLAYMAMPAISLFLLPAAAAFGVAKIHSLPRDKMASTMDPEAMQNAAGLWARRHMGFLLCLFGGTFALAWIGATWMMLLLYLVSLGVLLYVLSSIAKLGLANRFVIGESCLMGLIQLAGVSGFCGIGDHDIHFVDQMLIVPVFFGGALVLVPLVWASSPSQLADWRRKRISPWILSGLIVPVIAWFMSPILWPATPERIKSHVESFDKAPNSSASWRQWEIVASWAIESKLDPDLSGARRLLANEIAGLRNPFVLGSAFRVRLVRPDQVGQLREYDQRRQALLDDRYQDLESLPILSLGQEEWVIRVSAMRNDLSPSDRNFLEKRLHATLDKLAESNYAVLETALRVTQLLDVIERPVDPAKYRDRVFDWLRKLHSKKGGGFGVAGGFRQSLNLPDGSVEETSYAVRLMLIYGIPDGLDLNWVRSFLRPRFLTAWTEDKWINAVTLLRLNRLAGATQPTWLEIVYYERSLIMAVLLVTLCIYATVSSPLPGRTLSGAGWTPGAVPSEDMN